MAGDDAMRKFLEAMQQRQDEHYREYYGEERYQAMLRERRLRHVCYKCPYRCVDDEGGLEPCDLPADAECMRQHEEDFIKMEEDERG